ncbi:MAG: hypothetical protein XXXJIFNMEKO3_03434 [Candidatus Erwinia impunctatus]|nr:hypothetical protein XXXJIFNMEKO_03434 [Culicoides impunctatus]
MYHGDLDVVRNKMNILQAEYSPDSPNREAIRRWIQAMVKAGLLLNQL